MTIETTSFGILPDGSEVEKYILKNTHGIQVEIITYGAIITSIIVPDKNRDPVPSPPTSRNTGRGWNALRRA